MKTLNYKKRIQNALSAFLCTISCGTPLFAQESQTLLKPNDIIKVEVFDEPKVSVPGTTINNSGDATLPLLGQVNLSKLNLEQAAEKIKQLYQMDYIVDPKVTVMLLKEAEKIVSILGAVNKTGQIAIPPSGLDLSTALATVGGLSPTSDPKNIVLMRASGERAVYTAADVSSGKAATIKLLAGDRIIVGQNPLVNKFINVQGHIARKGLIPYPLDGNADLSTIIGACGGFTDMANKKIELTRNGKKTIIDLDDNNVSIQLLPSDIINALQRRF